MIRRVRKEVLTQLPPRTDTRVPVEMTPQQREEHDELYLPIRRLISIMKVRPLRVEEHLRLMSLLNTQLGGVAQLLAGQAGPPAVAPADPGP